MGTPAYFDQIDERMRHIFMKQRYIRPIQVSEDNGSYRRIYLFCPNCQAPLTSYKAGPAWCENGLYSCECNNCRCGQLIDYTGIPFANSKN